VSRTPRLKNLSCFHGAAQKTTELAKFEGVGMQNRVGFLIIMFAFSSAAKAQVSSLNEVALFERCFLQITSSRISHSDPLFLQVKAGAKTAVNACLETMDRAKLVANGNQTIAIESDVRAKAVLSTFHRLHSSWFTSKDFPLINQDGYNGDEKNLFDSTTPALYFTRALFRPATEARTAVTGSLNLRAYRTTLDPIAGAESGNSKSDYVFDPPVAFAPTGELIGVQETGSMILNYAARKQPKPIPAGSLDLFRNIGGGLLGTNAYLLLNTASMATDEDFKSDGGVVIHRRWGKAVFDNLFCREIPVVRESDAVRFVEVKSSIPFRNSSACVKCHASQDRVASVVRNMNIFGLGKGTRTPPGTTARGGQFPAFYDVTQGAEATWPTEPDPVYYQRPPNGVLFLRSFSGDLIERPVTSVADLGQKISETDDYYVCLAKRYYSYFTGINVNNGDLGDPYRSQVMTAGDTAHRNVVIDLGKKLKAHQSLRQLISDILNLNDYRKTDFGISGDTNGQ
jgi:hypothetical protein